MQYTINPFTGKLDAVNTPVVGDDIAYQGDIALNSDFPTTAEVETGFVYRVTATVTDDDATKTNTGLSFIDGDEIMWDGSTWELLGNYVSLLGTANNWTGLNTFSNDVKIVAGKDLVLGGTAVVGSQYEQIVPASANPYAHWGNGTAGIFFSDPSGGAGLYNVVTYKSANTSAGAQAKIEIATINSATEDSGSVAVGEYRAYMDLSTPVAIVTRPIFQWKNATTAVMTLGAAGGLTITGALTMTAGQVLKSGTSTNNYLNIDNSGNADWGSRGSINIDCDSDNNQSDKGVSITANGKTTILATFLETGVTSFLGNIRPFTNDAASLGISGAAFSDLFLATGAVINIGSGVNTITESSGNMTIAASGSNILRSNSSVAIDIDFDNNQSDRTVAFRKNAGATTMMEISEANLVTIADSNFLVGSSSSSTRGIEIGDSSATGTTPYIDFSFGVTGSEDYNIRLINSASGNFDIIAQTLVGSVLDVNMETTQLHTVQIESGSAIQGATATGNSLDFDSSSNIILGTADNDIIMDLDSNNDGSTSNFIVRANGSTEVFNIAEDGSIDQTVTTTGTGYALTKNQIGTGMSISMTVDSASDLQGLLFDINNAGAGLEHAFRFNGAEAGITDVGDGGFVSNNNGTFTLVGFVRVNVAGSTYYSPYGTIS